MKILVMVEDICVRRVVTDAAFRDQLVASELRSYGSWMTMAINSSE